MNTSTINISLPSGLYKDAKAVQKKRGYASLSELIREALRDIVYPRLTVNGFTSKFEDEFLKAANEPVKKSQEWDGKTPFSEFVLKNVRK